MTGVLTREKRGRFEIQRQRKRPSEDGSKNWT